MPISGNQNLDPNSTKYGLPTDTCCVGAGGPTPHEVQVLPEDVGKSPVQTGGKIPVGYNGP